MSKYLIARILGFEELEEFQLRSRSGGRYELVSKKSNVVFHLINNELASQMAKKQLEGDYFICRASVPEDMKFIGKSGEFLINTKAPLFKVVRGDTLFLTQRELSGPDLSVSQVVKIID